MNKPESRFPSAIALGFAAALAMTIVALPLSGCEGKSTAPVAKPTAKAAADDHDHDGHDHDGHDDAHAAGDADHGDMHDGGDGDQVHGDGHGHGHSGKIIELGSATIGGFDVKLTRDADPIVAGGEGAFDATITGGTGNIAAVRFWVGTADAKGSMKAKAEIEDPKEPNRWHTHAEVPKPMPADSKLWVEVENDKGEKSTGSFDLKS